MGKRASSDMELPLRTNLDQHGKDNHPPKILIRSRPIVMISVIYRFEWVTGNRDKV